MFRLPLDDALALVLLEERHAPLLASLVAENREHLGHFLPWALTTDEASVRAFLRAGLDKFAHGNGFETGMWLDGELVGMLGVHYLDRVVGRTEFGYWIARRASGRGVVTRAVAGLTRVMFEEYGLNRVEIRCQPDNVPSRRVAERLGFRHEGTLRAVHPAGGGEPADLEVFGLLRSEWQRQERSA
jgi:ribosomal-protein-serine acetyltransferase